MPEHSKVWIHPTAEISRSAEIGEGTRIWNLCQIREGAHIGKMCIVGRGVYVDSGVRIGDKVKIQNHALIYHGTIIENGVFIGPGVIFTNDKRPRSINPDGKIKSDTDWTVGTIYVREGASIGAGCVILPDIVIGKFAMVGAGSLVSRDVPDFGLMIGNPARLVGFVCKCGSKLSNTENRKHTCSACGSWYELMPLVDNIQK